MERTEPGALRAVQSLVANTVKNASRNASYRRLVEASRRALRSGAVASVLSTAATIVCASLEGRSPAGPMNGPSQWIWGRHAAHARRARPRHTLPGYLIHHAASTFWALVYEYWRGAGRETRAPDAAKAASTAALAYYVDFRLTPLRLRPGFEVQLSRRSLAATYAAFALGLAIAARRARSRGRDAA